MGFIELFIGYENDKPVIAHVFGVANTLDECKENGRKIVASVIDSHDAPTGATGILACVPIPPATQGQHAEAKRIQPTPDQKETRL